MRPGGNCVHIGPPDLSVPDSCLVDPDHLALVGDLRAGQALQHHPKNRVVPDLHLAFLAEQVQNLLHVYLRHLDFDLAVELIALRLDPLEEVLDDPGDQAPLLLVQDVPLHCVGLPRGGLAVGHYRAVPPVEEVLDDRLADPRENRQLVVLVAEHIIEGEAHRVLVLRLGVLALDHLVPLQSDLAQLRVFLLELVWWSKSANYLDVLGGGHLDTNYK